MKSTEIKFTAIPSTEEVKAERDRLAYRSRYGRVLRSTIYALVVVAAVAVLLATLFLPVLQVSGDSMNPTLEDKDILLLVKSDSMKTGDLCGFYWQNKLLLKRVIGQPGDVISMDEDGHVTVNGTVLDEPYVDELALGECDIRFPYQVPENRYFVLGDHRSVSIDSRSSVIGCVEKSQVVGRVFLRIWPLTRLAVFGFVPAERANASRLRSNVVCINFPHLERSESSPHEKDVQKTVCRTAGSSAGTGHGCTCLCRDQCPQRFHHHQQNGEGRDLHHLPHVQAGQLQR